MAKKITERLKQNLEDFFVSDIYKEHKTLLVRYISDETGKRIDTVRRNINRMENYYKKTGLQSRSGVSYIPLIQKYIHSLKTAMEISGAEFVGIFPTLNTAKEYTKGLNNILHIVFNDNFEPVVYRFYTQGTAI